MIHIPVHFGAIREQGFQPTILHLDTLLGQGSHILHKRLLENRNVFDAPVSWTWVQSAHVDVAGLAGHTWRSVGVSNEKESYGMVRLAFFMSLRMVISPLTPPSPPSFPSHPCAVCELFFVQ